MLVRILIYLQALQFQQLEDVNHGVQVGIGLYSMKHDLLEDIYLPV